MKNKTKKNVPLLSVGCQSILPADCNNVFDGSLLSIDCSNVLLLSADCNSVPADDCNSVFGCGLLSGGCNRLPTKA